MKGPVPEEDYEIPFGQAAVVRDGKDLTLVAMAGWCRMALKAGEKLAAEGMSMEVIDPRTVAPLDIETILNRSRRRGVC